MRSRVQKVFIAGIIFVLVASCTLTNSMASFFGSSTKRDKENTAVISRFIMARDGDLWMVNLKQDDLRRITFTEDIHEGGAELSPDGMTIAFNDPYSGEMYFMDADGTNVEKLSLGEGNHKNAVWSHDGQKILYVTDFYQTDETEYRAEVSIYDIASEDVDLIFTSEKSISGVDFSPDDETIVMSLGQNICTISASGEDITEIAVSEEEQWFVYPQYSPDGRMILFQNWKTGEKIGVNSQGVDIMGLVSDLFVVNSDGSELNQLTDTETSEANAVWSPSSDRIFYIVYDGEDLSTFKVMDLDDSDVRTLLYFDDFPALAAATATSTSEADVYDFRTKTITRPLTATLTELNIPYGGTLEKEGPYVANSCIDLYVENFMAEAVFIVPAGVSAEDYSFGLLFRDRGSDNQWRIILTNGYWYQKVGIQSPGTDSGKFAMHFEQGSINRVQIYVKDDTGYLFLNDAMVDTLDLSQRMGTGDVCVGGQFYSNDNENIDIVFEDFSVWALE